MGSLGQAHTLAGENPLPRLRLRGLDLTRQVVPGASFPLSVPIDGAWPDRFHWRHMAGPQQRTAVLGTRSAAIQSPRPWAAKGAKLAPSFTATDRLLSGCSQSL